MAITDIIKGLLGGQNESQKDGQKSNQSNGEKARGAAGGSQPVLTVDDTGATIDGNELPDHATALHALEEAARDNNQWLRYEAKGELHLTPKQCASLNPATAEALGFPDAFPGEFKVSFKGRTTQPGFSARISPILAGEQIPSFSRQGAILSLGATERYRLNKHQLMLFDKVASHGSETSEAENVSLLLALKKLQKRGVSIDLGIFEAFSVDEVKKPSVAVSEGADGSLQLKPHLAVTSRSQPLAADDIAARLGQIDAMTGNTGVLRVKDRFLVLGKKCLAGIRDIVSQPTIPAAEKSAFIESPGMFLDSRLVDLDGGFTYQMKGVEAFSHIPFGASEKSLLPWFGDEPLPCLDVSEVEDLFSSPGEAQVLRSMAESARDNGCSEVFFRGKRVSIADWQAFEDQLSSIMERLSLAAGPIDTEAEPGERDDTIVLSPAFHKVQKDAKGLKEQVAGAEGYEFERYDNLKKTPFPHQQEAVEWLMKLYKLATSPASADDQQHQSVPRPRVQGALLGDDMGLGKSFITLSFLNEIARHDGDDMAPVLLVAPLSLLKNWQDEMLEAYHDGIFADTVVLQSDEDLRQYLVTRPTVETKVSRSNLAASEGSGGGNGLSMSAIRYGLKVGESFGDGSSDEARQQRLDVPRRLVLTTYQVLRDYPFSLAKVRWSAVIFDEGQAIKNPNSMQTRGAKALSANFKLMLTGTPVENSFADIWCLMDISQPGLLGDWQGFKEQFIAPILAADPQQQLALKDRLGQQLRSLIGPFMLRRLKRDVLKDLPPKNIHKGVTISDEPSAVDGKPTVSVHNTLLAKAMPDDQVAAYDSVIGSYQRKGASREDDSQSAYADDSYDESAQETGSAANTAIVSLMHLKNISLHPALAADELPVFDSPAQAEAFMARSAKTQILKEVLDQIKAKGEKAIVFVIARKMQWLMKACLESLYEQDVAIINGDTKAVVKPSARTGGEPELTRKQLIDEFQQQEGFGVIIISPIAAGTGLTITKANHVVHLERHWNPAKEAQATDRVYRIGQDKPVHIYYPFALHPEKHSFDVNLDMLLSRKEDLGAAVSQNQAQPNVKASEVVDEMVKRELS